MLKNFFYKLTSYFSHVVDHSVVIELKNITSVQHTTYTNPFFMLTFAEVLTLSSAVALATKLAITVAIAFSVAVATDISGWDEVVKDVAATAVVYAFLMFEMVVFRNLIAASWLSFLSWRSPLTLTVGALVCLMIIGTAIVADFHQKNPTPEFTGVWECNTASTLDSVAIKDLDAAMCRKYNGNPFKCPSQNQPDSLCDDHIRLAARIPWISAIIALGLWVLGNIILFLISRLKYPRKNIISVFITTTLGYAVVNWELPDSDEGRGFDSNRLYAIVRAYPPCNHQVVGS